MKKKVLIVEDDVTLRQLVVAVLEAAGYETHEAANGQEGWQSCLKVGPDLLLLDLMMPVLNGVELIKLLQANGTTKRVPIVVMTAHADKGEELERSGAARRVLRKPFDMAELTEAAARLLAPEPAPAPAPARS